MENTFGETCLTYFKHHYQNEMNHALKVFTSSLATEGTKQD